MTSFPAAHMRHMAPLLGTRSKRQRRRIRDEQKPKDVEILTHVTWWGVREGDWIGTTVEPTSRDDRPIDINGLGSRSWVEVPPVVSATDRRKERTGLSFNDSVVAGHNPDTPKPTMVESKTIRRPQERNYSPNYKGASESAKRMRKAIDDHEAAKTARRVG